MNVQSWDRRIVLASLAVITMTVGVLLPLATLETSADATWSVSSPR